MKIALRYFTVVVLILLFAACDQPTPGVPTPTIAPIVTIKNRKSEIRNPEVIPYVVENCNGTSPVGTNPGRSRSTTVEINIKLGGSVEFEAPVKAKIEAEFSHSDGETVTSNQDFDLKADPGRKVTYEITWAETWQVGDAEFKGISFPFEIRTGVKGDLGSGTPESCPMTLTAQALPATTAPIATNTAVSSTAALTDTSIPSTATKVSSSTPVPPTATPAPTDTSVPPTSTLAPTETSVPPSPIPPSLPPPTAGATVQLHVYATRDSLTLFISDKVSLIGFQFGVVVDSKLKLVSLADTFPALLLSASVANANDCYVYQADGAAPPLSQSCKGQVFRTNMAAADVFWYDSVTNQPRDLAIFRDGQTTGIICSAATPDCAVDWTVVPITPQPPVSIPTVTPSTSLLSRAYPCDGKIIFTTGALLNQVKILPQKNAPSSPPVKQGTDVMLLAKQKNEGTDWYQITYANNSGWIPSDYVIPSNKCPSS